VPTILVLGGTLGYYLIEYPNYSWLDALYMTVITLTTVGYGEVHTLSDAGRWFTMVLLLVGVFTLFFAATEIVRLVVGGELRLTLGRRAMERNLAGLSQHLIVCGYGRVGKLVCREFSRQKLRFVIIDRRPEALTDFDLPHGIPLVGEATDDEVLKRAGVERARSLVSVAPSDADNLYVTMSARLLNEGLFIVSRAETEGAEKKLKRAGANRVVSPHVISGYRVAQAVVRPAVVDFIELWSTSSSWRRAPSTWICRSRKCASPPAATWPARRCWPVSCGRTSASSSWPSRRRAVTWSSTRPATPSWNPATRSSPWGRGNSSTA
jgi:voltage-gated potassium channel